MSGCEGRGAAVGPPRFADGAWAHSKIGAATNCGRTRLFKITVNRPSPFYFARLVSLHHLVRLRLGRRFTLSSLQIPFIQKNEGPLQKSKHSVCLLNSNFWLKYRDMVFRPEFTKGYGKMVYVPNLISLALPNNLVEIMHLAGIDGLDGFLRLLIHIPPLPFMQLRSV